MLKRLYSPAGLISHSEIKLASGSVAFFSMSLDEFHGILFLHGKIMACQSRLARLCRHQCLVKSATSLLGDSFTIDEDILSIAAISRNRMDVL